MVFLPDSIACGKQLGFGKQADEDQLWRSFQEELAHKSIPLIPRHFMVA
jgi:hypothetical protein